MWFAMALALAAATAGAGGLVDLEGRPQRLQAHVGQGDWVVVMVWASTCHVCNAEAHEMVAFHTAHAGRGARVLGVAIDGHDNRAAVDQFIARHKLNFPNLIDDGISIVEVFARDVGMAWEGWTPTYLIYEPGGRLVAKNIGPVSRQDIEQFMATYRPAPRPR